MAAVHRHGRGSQRHDDVRFFECVHVAAVHRRGRGSQPQDREHCWRILRGWRPCTGAAEDRNSLWHRKAAWSPWSCPWHLEVAAVFRVGWLFSNDITHSSPIVLGASVGAVPPQRPGRTPSDQLTRVFGRYAFMVMVRAFPQVTGGSARPALVRGSCRGREPATKPLSATGHVRPRRGRGCAAERSTGRTDDGIGGRVALHEADEPSGRTDPANVRITRDDDR